MQEQVIASSLLYVSLAPDPITRDVTSMRQNTDIQVFDLGYELIKLLSKTFPVGKGILCYQVWLWLFDSE